MLKQTKIAIQLRRPTTLKLRGGTETITELRIYVDNPRAFVTAARQRLSEPQAVEPVASQAGDRPDDARVAHDYMTARVAAASFPTSAGVRQQHKVLRRQRRLRGNVVDPPRVRVGG